MTQREKDLVEELRQWGEALHTPTIRALTIDQIALENGRCISDAIADAADEIERLRKQCEGLAESAMNNGAEILKLETEITRLRAPAGDVVEQIRKHNRESAVEFAAGAFAYPQFQLTDEQLKPYAKIIGDLLDHATDFASGLLRAPVGDEGRLRDKDAPMANDYQQITAAEDVLTWLVVEKIGGYDGDSLTPNEACSIIVNALSDAAERPDPSAKLREALERSIVALDDWTHSYAPELCDENCVKETAARIGEHGTIYYIASIQSKNREALASTPAGEPSSTKTVVREEIRRDHERRTRSTPTGRGQDGTAISKDERGKV